MKGQPSRFALIFGLLLALWTASAFLTPHPVPPLQPRPPRQPLAAFRRVSSESVKYYYAVTEIVREGDDYVMTTTRFSSDEPSPQTWLVKRRYDQLDEFQRKMNSQLGYILPVFPPINVLDASLLPLADYMNKMLELDQVKRRQELMDFLEVPASIRADDSNVVTYKPDIIDDYGRVMGEQTPQEVSKGAAVAGAVTGFMMGGPFGAVVGGIMGGLAANRGDLLGDVAKSAGKVTNVGINKLKEVDDRYRVSERVGDVVKQGVEKVKQAVDKLDE